MPRFELNHITVPMFCLFLLGRPFASRVRHFIALSSHKTCLVAQERFYQDFPPTAKEAQYKYARDVF
jgi:hypothetical protein